MSTFAFCCPPCRAVAPPRSRPEAAPLSWPPTVTGRAPLLLPSRERLLPPPAMLTMDAF